jgi:anti-sigma factor RsiW
MNCDKIREIIMTDYIDGELGDEARALVDAHIAGCKGCREFLTSVQKTAVTPFKDIKKEAPPERVWHKIRASIEEKQAVNPLNDIIDALRRLLYGHRKQVLAFATAAIIIVMAVFAGRLPLMYTADTKTSANTYMQDQADFMSTLNGGGAATYTEEAGLGTGVEEYFL